jgi:hypothetical protein
MQRVFALLAALAQMTAPGWIARNDPPPATSAALGRAPGAPATTHASTHRELRSRFANATSAPKAMAPRRFARRGSTTLRRFARADSRAVTVPPLGGMPPPPLILRI